VHEYKGEPCKGWVIPPRVEIHKAEIRCNGKVIYDGLEHPLRLISLTSSFCGKVDLQELKNHLYYDHRHDDAIPYHFRQQYQSWKRDWGFCVTRSFYDSLTDDEYEVEIQTSESEGNLQVLDLFHQGDLAETICFVSHLDHPGMSNDDLAGCVVGIELMRKIQKLKTKWSYRLVLVPEMTGSEFYLTETLNREDNPVIEAMFLESLGSDTSLALQHSLNSDTQMEYFLKTCLEDGGIKFREGPFKSIICNDESIWEAHGISTSSFSRYPYPEYHTDKDNPSIIAQGQLEEAVNCLMAAVGQMESNPVLIKDFTGSPCLSNPEYNLYVDPGQPAFGDKEDPQIQKLRLLMDFIPIIQGPKSITWISMQLGIDANVATDYLLKWQEKGLVRIV